MYPPRRRAWGILFWCFRAQKAGVDRIIHPCKGSTYYDALVVYRQGELTPMAGKLRKTGGKPCVKIRVCGQAQKGGSRAGNKERHAAAAISQGLGLVKPGDQGAAEGLMELTWRETEMVSVSPSSRARSSTAVRETLKIASP